MAFAPEGLSIEEAAHACGVSDETIRRRLRANKLPNAARVAGPSSAWRIPVADLVADGLVPTSPTGDGLVSEVARLREALESSERLLAERQARIDELQAHLSDLRSLALRTEEPS